MSWITKRRLRQCGFVVGLLLWAFAVGAGIEYIWRYKSTPGTTAATPATWPESSRVTRLAGQSTLIMFVHPRCTCSRASLEELKDIMEHAPAAVSAWVLFLRPSGTTQAWESTPSWSAARAIPGVKVLVDRNGAEAARFGASTSGHVVLYDGGGRLDFAGGITSARGHVGENSGSRSVAAYLGESAGELQEHPVFGCAFHVLDREPG